MKIKCGGAIALVMAGLGAASSAQAALISYGVGSAVNGTPSYEANFNGIPGGTSLLNYAEGGVTASVDDTQCCFNNAFFGFGGNFGYVTISTVDGTDVGAMEVGIGSGFVVVQSHYVVWETLRDGVSTGSGVVQIDNIGYLGADNSPFVVVGWTDVGLFDTLRLGAAPTSLNYTAFGGRQGIALDSVRIGEASTSQVPEPASLAMVGLGMAALTFRRRKTWFSGLQSGRQEI